MLIAYSTAGGELASDVGDGAGLYAKACGGDRETRRRGGGNVPRGAASREGNDQPGTVPRVQCHGRCVLRGTGGAEAHTSGERRSWEWGHVDRDNVAELEAFTRRHPTSPYADYARWRIDSLKHKIEPEVSSVEKGSPPNERENSVKVGLSLEEARKRLESDRAQLEAAERRSKDLTADVAKLGAKYERTYERWAEIAKLIEQSEKLSEARLGALGAQEKRLLGSIEKERNDKTALTRAAQGSEGKHRQRRQKTSRRDGAAQ